MATSTQSNISYSNEVFRQYLFQLSTGLVWKNTTKAAAGENNVDSYLTELFIVAHRGLLNFDIVRSFPRAVLRNSGVSEADIEIFAADKNRIPANIRPVVIEEYTNALTSINPVSGKYEYYDTSTGKFIILYEEKNNYYRALMGLPDVGDTNYIYNTDPRWDTTIPVHMLSVVDRLEMENAGIVETLVKNNPTKDYLKYIGKKSITFFSARVADRFECIYRDDVGSAAIEESFDTEYNRSRAIVNSVYYSNAYKKTNALYDNFLAMCILFMTLQSMQYRYLQVDIVRDFYDTESIKLVYDSYEVPFYSDIPLDYHKRIVKNINKLISYKGSSQVFFDLFDIFDLGTMDIYSYFLTKTHKMNSEGNPSFIIKKDEEGRDMYDKDGNPILDEENFEVKFSKVKIYDDPALSVSDRANDVEYAVLTDPDPYWIQDASLIAKLDAEKFNYAESKYIGIQTIFDLMRITYENAYIFRLITDNKTVTGSLNFNWTDLNIQNVSVYSLFMYLASLYCRAYGYEGIISDNIPAVMDTLGYNFEEAMEILQKDIYTNPYLNANKKLKDLILNMNLTNIESINSVFGRIEEIRKLVSSGYTKAKTRAEFFAYRNLYNSLLVSKEITSVYTDKNGNVYELFTDILSDVAPDLMQRYLLLRDEAISDEMNITITQLERLISNLRYLPFSAGVSSSTMIESLFRILKFFKSAKAELIGYNITYVISMRGESFFKMLDILKSSVTTYYDHDIQDLMDLLKIRYDFLEWKSDVYKMMDKIQSQHYKRHIVDKIMRMDDIIKSSIINLEVKYRDDVRYIDFVNSVHDTIRISSNMLLSDKGDAELLHFIHHEALFLGRVKDEIRLLTDSLRLSPDDIEITILVDILQCLDKIKEIRETYYSNKLFRTDAPMTDSILFQSVDYNEDIELFNDFFKVLNTITHYHKDGNNYTDKPGDISEDTTTPYRTLCQLIDLTNTTKDTIRINDRQIMTDYLFEHDTSGNMIVVS